MGLAGLGLAGRAAATALPGYVRAPVYVTEPWVALSLLAFLALAPLYLAKLVRHPGALRDELVDPAQLGFCGALPVGLSLVAGGLGPYLPAAASALWWTGCALMLAFQVGALARWLAGGMALAELNAGWLLVTLGGLAFPWSGIGLGHFEAARFVFGVSLAATPLMMALVLYRAAFAPSLPERLRPSWFLLVVPPSLAYANGTALYGASPLLESLYFFALVLAAALLVSARRLARGPFGAPGWAFTFALDALAYAAARYAQDHPSAPWRAVAAATLLLAVLAMLLVLWRTFRSAASQQE